MILAVVLKLVAACVPNFVIVYSCVCVMVRVVMVCVSCDGV